MQIGCMSPEIVPHLALAGLFFSNADTQGKVPCDEQLKLERNEQPPKCD